jgi:hypothetical protein
VIMPGKTLFSTVMFNTHPISTLLASTTTITPAKSVALQSGLDESTGAFMP